MGSWYTYVQLFMIEQWCLHPPPTQYTLCVNRWTAPLCCIESVCTLLLYNLGLIVVCGVLTQVPPRSKDLGWRIRFPIGSRSKQANSVYLYVVCTVLPSSQVKLNTDATFVIVYFTPNNLTNCASSLFLLMLLRRSNLPATTTTRPIVDCLLSTPHNYTTQLFI